MGLRSTKIKSNQLELPIERRQSPDRNSAQGGRSFYFFDFDDNVVFLPTPLYLFHKVNGSEKAISTREFAAVAESVGHSGTWKDYEIRPDPQTGSFRRFRHRELNLIDKILRRKQPLHEDLLQILKRPHFEWRGPSWDFFWHAVHNGRPLSIITARGHHPNTIKEAIGLLHRAGHLSHTPNFLSIYPVSHLGIRTALGDKEHKWSTGKLKTAAIKESVKAAFEVYGQNPAHRFGMSDDDPANVRVIIEAMRQLKKEYPENSFFVVDTQGGNLFKQEVFVDSVKTPEPLSAEQLNLF